VSNDHEGHAGPSPGQVGPKRGQTATPWPASPTLGPNRLKLSEYIGWEATTRSRPQYVGLAKIHGWPATWWMPDCTFLWNRIGQVRNHPWDTINTPYGHWERPLGRGHLGTNYSDSWNELRCPAPHMATDNGCWDVVLFRNGMLGCELKTPELSTWRTEMTGWPTWYIPRWLAGPPDTYWDQKNYWTTKQLNKWTYNNWMKWWENRLPWCHYGHREWPLGRGHQG
jgi:hypothetical protein